MYKKQHVPPNEPESNFGINADNFDGISSSSGRASDLISSHLYQPKQKSGYFTTLIEDFLELGSTFEKDDLIKEDVFAATLAS